MVSIKFWRGKFSRPATGYECIAHAQTFDRGVSIDNHSLYLISQHHICKVELRPRPHYEEEFKNGGISLKTQQSPAILVIITTSLKSRIMFSELRFKKL